MRKLLSWFVKIVHIFGPALSLAHTFAVAAKQIIQFQTGNSRSKSFIFSVKHRHRRRALFISAVFLVLIDMWMSLYLYVFVMYAG